MLAFSGTVGMYIFLPALPLVAQDLGASSATVQLTVSLYIVGLALGQLVYGPLSDRFGRRPVLLVGLALFTVASVASACAPSATILLGMRLLQGFGGSAGLVLGRAIVRDTSVHSDTARRLAVMNLMVSIGPALAPILGAAIASTLGWRAVLFTLAGLGFVNLLCSARWLSETRPALDAAKASWSGLRGNYLQLMRSPVFLGYAAGGGLATTAVYGFFAAAPFIFVQQLHRPAHEAGLFLTMQVSGLWFGTLLAMRLIQSFAVRALLVWSNAVSLAMGTCFLAMAALDSLNLPAVAVVMFIYSLGVGVAAPTALAEAVNVDPAVVGTASGIYGFSQMAVGAACSALVGLGDNPSLSSGLVLVGAGIVSQASFRFAARSDRRAAARDAS